MQVYQVITFQTLLIPASHPHESFRITFGGFLQAFSVRILAQTFEDGANSASKPLLPFELFCRSCIQSKEGGLC